MDSPLLPSLSRHSQGQPPPSFNLFDTSLESLKLQDLSFTDDHPSQQVGSAEHLFNPPSSSGTGDVSFDTPPRVTRLAGHRKAGAPPPAGSNRAGAGKPRFSLFAQPKPEPTPPSPVEQGQYTEEEDGEDGHKIDGGGEEDDGQTLRLSELASSTGLAEEREATLKKTLFDLQRLNGVFEGYIGALESNNAFHSRIADQTMFTNSLLDDYIHILSASQKVASLVQNPQWEGAEADERAGMARQMALLQAQEQAMREAAIRAEAEAAELQRRQELRAEEVRAAAMAASMSEGRVGRGGAVGRGRGRGVGAGSSGIPTSSSSSAGGRGKIPTYSGVRSSGYGPPPKKK
ncbi:DASH complex subunit Duo1 [Phaffia rhodozyma]|uniref:DASH complex subunit DUO1 n=1 Tax=Phaffia rhodozyma TaxID=264483 RepID=A0A0F7SL57_PHARH|nr:DASH complex subunit Duo1 [Phaffia rhodozyma]